MHAERKRFLEGIAGLARRLPIEALEAVSVVLEAAHEPPSAALQQRVLLELPTAGARGELKALLKLWKEAAPEVVSSQVAWALRAAAEAVQAERSRQRLELVWTGPTPGSATFRRTDQALLEVVEQAQKTLYLVTFAAYELGALKGR